MRFDELANVWERLGKRGRLALVAGAVALLTVSVLISSALHDNRVALFASPLQGDQLAEVDAQLSMWSVPFVTVADNVRVDPGRRAELLARLTLAGVPHAHLAGTSEALASLGALTPQSILDAQSRAGLEGDLSKGLRGIGEIADARVIIAPAHGGLFADEPPTTASASVRLTAVGGATLSPATLEAVRAFVAAGVPGLRAERVTVVDERGTVESGGERALANRQGALQSALDAAFGAGATIVRVHLDGERTTAAVIVDARRALDLAKIKEVAAATAGIEPRRGDTLSVEEVSFDRPESAAPSPLGRMLGIAVEALPVVATAVVAIVALRAGAEPLGTLVREIVRRVRFEGRAAEAVAGSLSPDAIFAILRNEPPHAAAAIVAKLEAPLAAAVLEMYEPERRRAIVARLARRVSPLVPDAQALLRDA